MLRVVTASSLLLAFLLLAPLAHAGDQEKKEGDAKAEKAKVEEPNKDKKKEEGKAKAEKKAAEKKAKAEKQAAAKKAKAEKKPGEKKPKAEKKPNPNKAAKEKKPHGAAGVVKSLDASTKSITITHNNKKKGTSEDKIFTVADDAKITVGGQPATLADVVVGKRAKLTLSADGQKVSAISVGHAKKAKENKEKKPAA